jgi:hypothetical protein
VAYSFGKTGAEHKAMDITVPVQMTGYAYQSNQIISLQGFTVRNGDTTYLASAGSDDESKPFARSMCTGDSRYRKASGDPYA